MKILLITFSTMLIVIFFMALGVVFSNKRLKGSCGGLGKVMGGDCDFCEKKKINAKMKKK